MSRPKPLELFAFGACLLAVGDLWITVGRYRVSAVESSYLWTIPLALFALTLLFTWRGVSWVRMKLRAGRQQTVKGALPDADTTGPERRVT